MDRRGFFKNIARKSTEKPVEIVEKKVNRRAANWIRPPYALDEADFLLACSRCNRCVEACPHQVIFKLPERLGAQIAFTPALDLLKKGCHQCEDWPCVNACQDKALVLPEPDSSAEQDEIPQELPKMARAEINSKTCLPYNGHECDACADSCPVPGALTWDMTLPIINLLVCTGCGMCREVCVADPKAVNIKSLHNSLGY
ncbi:MAG: ferredoxin-type protein NapG [Gammaproteobacteria bacterium]|jgi:ferredoxin-type protein NapG